MATVIVTEAHTHTLGHKQPKPKTELVCHQHQMANITQAAKGRDVPDCELDI